MYTYSDIRVTITNEVGFVVLNRPEKGNSISKKMAEELKHSFQQLDKDDSVRVIVLTGEGKYFCTGADLSTAGAGGSSFVEILETIRNCKKPIVCKVNGPGTHAAQHITFSHGWRMWSCVSYRHQTSGCQGIF